MSCQVNVLCLNAYLFTFLSFQIPTSHCVLQGGTTGYLDKGVHKEYKRKKQRMLFLVQGRRLSTCTSKHIFWKQKVIVGWLLSFELMSDELSKVVNRSHLPYSLFLNAFEMSFVDFRPFTIWVTFSKNLPVLQ